MCILLLDYQELNINYTENLVCSQNRKGIVRDPDPDIDMYFTFSDMTSDEGKWQKASCEEKLKDRRFYWELQWTGFVCIALKEGKSRFKGKTLKLFCHSHQCFAMHAENFHTKTVVAVDLDHNCVSNTFGVYLDCPEGTLSFYNISSRGVNHLYTFHTTFNEPLIPEFHLARPLVMGELSSLIIATQSPGSVQRTKAQLFQQLIASEIW